MKQPTALNTFAFKQGAATVVVDFDNFCKNIPFDKLVYLNGKVADRMLDVLENMLLKDIADE
jgi:hypothetical protein